jgi:magnesium chelatase subunit D
MGLAHFIGHNDARLALILNAIEPRCGGALFMGKKGTGKTTLARLFPILLPQGCPFITVPLNTTEDALIGAIDLEAAMKSGKKSFQAGLLSRAHGGVIFVDDINLLSNEALALLLGVHSRGANIVQREGGSEIDNADFLLLATMNPEEGALSPHFLDRFGMCVLWEELADKHDRLLLLKHTLQNASQGGDSLHPLDASLRNRVLNCRSFVKNIPISETILDHIARTCEENCVSSHRAELFLYYAARAYAAYSGSPEVQPQHVDNVAPLVLVHRRPHLMQAQATEESRSGQDKDNVKPPTEHPENQETPSDNQPSTGNAAGESKGETDDFSELKASSPSRFHEEIFEIGDTFRVRRFFFRRDRVKRASSGRRTRTKSKDRGGKYLRSILWGQSYIAIDATIRAAAPYQRIRARCDSMVITGDDIRYKQREKKTGHLVVFAVDGSGSMGAQKRMVESKAAVQSLLADCYLKRDRVAMVVFRKDKAEVVLPPTSSVELASRALREVPTGGKTPLSMGLLESYSLIKRYAKKAPETRFLLVVITDGRANHTITGVSPREEALRAAQLFRQLSAVDTIVVDTENKDSFMRADLAFSLAENLGAEYYTTSNLRADYLFQLATREKPDL